MTKKKVKNTKQANMPAPDTMLILNGTKFCIHLDGEKVRPGAITEVARTIGELLIKKFPGVDCYDGDAAAQANRVL